MLKEGVLSVNVLAGCMCMRIELTVRRKSTYAVARPSSSMAVSVKFFKAFGWSSKDLCLSPQQPSTTMLGLLLEIHKTKCLAPTPDENWYSMFPVSKLLYIWITREYLYFELFVLRNSYSLFIKLVLQYLGLPWPLFIQDYLSSVSVNWCVDRVG